LEVGAQRLYIRVSLELQSSQPQPPK
jgi:hypothetical protein